MQKQGQMQNLLCVYEFIGMKMEKIELFVSDLALSIFKFG